MSIPLMSWEVSPPGRRYTPPVRRPVTRSPPGQGVTPHRPGITRSSSRGVPVNVTSRPSVIANGSRKRRVLPLAPQGTSSPPPYKTRKPAAVARISSGASGETGGNRPAAA